MLRVYVDGSFYRGTYSGGYVIFDGNDIIYQDCGIGRKDPELVAMRNVSGEMTAAMRATNWLYEHKRKGIIYHDYNGLGYWARKEWKRNNPYTEAYSDYMYQHIRSGLITMEWVKGHKGIEGNEIADKLARQAILYNENWRF